MTTLPKIDEEEVLAFCRLAHDGQVDHGGSPYADHPIAVAGIVKRMHAALRDGRLSALSDYDEACEVAAAYLHDVLEDTPYTEVDLLRLVPQEVVDVVRLLTRSDGITYSQFIDSIIESGNVSAMRVKFADLVHNTWPSRVAQLPPGKQSITLRYEKAKSALLVALKHATVLSATTPCTDCGGAGCTACENMGRVER